MDLEELGRTAAAIGLGGFATAVVNMLTARAKDRRLAKSEVEKAAQALINTAMSAATGQLKAMREDIKEVHGTMDALRKEHLQCEVSLREVNLRLDASERAREDLKAQIDAHLCLEGKTPK